MRYLAAADLIVIHELLIATFGGMRGITEAGFGRLEAAAATPQMSAFGSELYAGVPAKAAALCLALVRAHPFSDGNKRIALVALDMLLTANGYALDASNDDAYTAIMALAQGQLDHAGLLAWLEPRVRPVGGGHHGLSDA